MNAGGNRVSQSLFAAALMPDHQIVNVMVETVTGVAAAAATAAVVDNNALVQNATTATSTFCSKRLILCLYASVAIKILMDCVAVHGDDGDDDDDDSVDADNADALVFNDFIQALSDEMLTTTLRKSAASHQLVARANNKKKKKHNNSNGSSTNATEQSSSQA
ncbi:hypothetical protein FF38_11793 [Lucilia cuprina]|uniref:Uncharacterized protein n=1 Tax=Lucilia cuprina TaxID=7375 RepID=A0A0L0C0P4_LUCCU|nr:hypothetical protein FF38_11793 [Lucilia cuprina]